MPSVAKSTPMKNWDWESVNMMDPTCTECERLLQTFEHAIRCLQIIEHKSAMETGLKGILRKASNRCEEARKAVEDHEATHMTVMAAAGATRLDFTATHPPLLVPQPLFLHRHTICKTTQ